MLACSAFIDCYPAGVSNKHCLLSLFSLNFCFITYILRQTLGSRNSAVIAENFGDKKRSFILRIRHQG